jgi:putative hemolysin
MPLLGAPADKPFDIRKVVREAVFVPESKTLRDLLGQFKTSKVHLAMVLDEYGGTAGLVTIEDVLEEIVGEIHDEHEPPGEEEPAIERVSDNTFDIDGRVRIDEANDELNVTLPEDEDYDTVGGFVFATLGRIPETGESFSYDNIHITVTDAEKTRVNKVRLALTDRSPEPSESDQSV